MILSKTIVVNITNSNIRFYKDIFNDITYGKKEIQVSLLPKNSSIKVIVKCDTCGKEYFNFYNKSHSPKYGYNACCSACAMGKNKITNIEKYGVEHSFQSEIIKEKSKESLLKKYGVDCYLKTSEIKEKTKITCLEKYGVEHHTQSEEIKKIKKNHF